MMPCPQARGEQRIRSDLLFVDNPGRRTQGYALCFHRLIEFEKDSARAKFPYGTRVLGLPGPFSKIPLTSFHWPVILSQTSERHGSERRNLSSERRTDRLSGPEVTGYQPSGLVAGGSTGAAVPGSFSDGLVHHRSRSRKGQANRGEGEPETRICPEEHGAGNSEGYSGLPRVYGTGPSLTRWTSSTTT